LQETFDILLIFYNGMSDRLTNVIIKRRTKVATTVPQTRLPHGF